MVVKGKGEVYATTVYKCPKGVWRFSSTISLASALDVGWVVNATPPPLYPGEEDPLKVKDSRNRPDLVQRVPGGLGSQIFMTLGA